MLAKLKTSDEIFVNQVSFLKNTPQRYPAAAHPDDPVSELVGVPAGDW